MKIIIEDAGENGEELLLLRCKELSPSILRLVAEIKNQQERLVVFQDNQIIRVAPADIYYFEAVDNKVFAYTDGQVFESRQKLYELEEAFGQREFLRVSKSFLLNLSKIESISPALDGRFEALLDNGEKIIITRSYAKDLKKRLGI